MVDNMDSLVYGAMHYVTVGRRLDLALAQR